MQALRVAALQARAVGVSARRQPFARLHAAAAGLLATLCLLYGPLAMHWTSWPASVGRFVNEKGFPPAGDFIAFYAASQFVAQGEAQKAYRFADFQPQLASNTSGRAPRLPYAYPPPYFVMIAPLAALPIWPALLAWWGALAACGGLAGWLASGRWQGVAAGVAFPAIGHSLATGQNGAISALCIGAAAGLWRRAPFWAGFALGCMIWKPHLAAGPALIAVLERNVRVILGGICGSAMLLVVSFAVLSPSHWPAFADALRFQTDLTARGAFPEHRMASIYGALLVAGAPALWAAVGHGVTAVLALWLCWRLWRREGAPDWARATAMAATAIVVSPYVYDYDLAVFAGAFAALIALAGLDPRRWTWPQTGWIMAVAGLLPLAYVVGQAWKVAIGGPLLLLLVIALERLVRPVDRAPASA
jgi:hypothetical protein